MKIVFDPGHGGRDPGVACGDLREAKVNLEVARFAAEALRARSGVVVWLTREDDSYVPLSARAKFANNRGADLFVSIHVNAGGGAGFESYRHPAASWRTRELHGTVHRRIAAFFGRYKRPDRGARLGHFYVLGATRMPALLLECLFLDNPAEAALLARAGFRRELGLAVAGAVAEALGRKNAPIRSG